MTADEVRRLLRAHQDRLAQMLDEADEAIRRIDAEDRDEYHARFQQLGTERGRP